jgi:hypothetical protein
MKATLNFSEAPAPLSNPLALAIGLLVAVVSGAVVIARWRSDPSGVSDIDQLWFAARAVLQGRDPYALIGPGREFSKGFPLYYPLPAAIILAPLAPLSVIVTRLVMAAGFGGLLAFCIARYDWRWLILFLSRPYYLNVWYVQWGTPLTCALFIPVLGFFIAAKPTNGAAMLTAFRDWRAVRVAVIAATVPVVVSLLLQPFWVPRWLDALGDGEHLRPFLAVPGGFVLALAAIRWKEWQGRLLLALSLVPQTLLQYGALPLLLIPRQRWGTVLLAALTFIPGFLAERAPFNARIADALARNDFATVTSTVGILTLGAVYVPALVFLLWPRHPMNPATKDRAPDPPPPLPAP